MTNRWKLLLLVSTAALVLAAVVMLPAATVNAQEATPQSNEDCLVCHQQEGLEMELASGHILPVTVDGAELEGSVHTGLGCQECHTDIEGYPHGEIVIQDRRDLTIHYSQSCANCHSDEALKQVDSVHARVAASGVREAAVCADCHGSHNIQPISSEKHDDIPPTASSDMCLKCHSVIHHKFMGSVHGEALEAGDPDAPSCISCHPAHTATDPRSLEFRLQSPEMCGTCHADEEMMERHDISTQVFETYVADFHGTTVMLFDKISPDQPTNKAVCTDCHGTHAIASLDDPEAAMGLQENLVETCRECHPDANTNFAESWLGHYWPNWETFPLVTAVTWFYRILIPALLGFFILYIVIDAQKRIRVRRAERKGAES
ncbi:MAG: cytochrome c3 family protein [Chloroflexota bacterium]|nr:cytochrome c3 family protein [Chloroflexota bacterium]